MHASKLAEQLNAPLRSNAAHSLSVIQKGSALNNYHIKVFVNHLELLSKFLTKIEVYVNSDPSILKARLIDDMLPLFAQVEKIGRAHV